MPTSRCLRFLIVLLPLSTLTPRRLRRRTIDYRTEQARGLEGEAHLALRDVPAGAEEVQRRLGGIAGGEVDDAEAVPMRRERDEEVRRRRLVPRGNLRDARRPLAGLVDEGADGL